MRTLLLLFIWTLSFTQSIHAQTADEVWAEMEAFVAAHLSESIPNEQQTLEALQLDLLNEGGGVAQKEKLVTMVRRSHWQKVFRNANQERFLAVEQNEREERDNSHELKPLLPNPNLVEECELNIVIIVDRSGSIKYSEINNIRAVLSNFVDEQVGTGNTITFVGMGGTEVGVPDAIISQSVTYNPGTTTVHDDWIYNTLSFGEDCDQCDSWSTGLVAANGLAADLVLMITDGNDDHGPAEPALTIAAANDLKSNGANNGNGAHIFVFGQDPGSYTGDMTLEETVSSLIAPNAMEAPSATYANIRTFDYFALAPSEAFAELLSWLAVLQPCCGEVATGWISNRDCVIGNVYISGTYIDCAALPAASVELEFWINSTYQFTAPGGIVNGNGTWTFTSTRVELEALGIMPGNWYDVFPVLTLVDGSTVTGTSPYISGINNDLYFPEHATPEVILNTSPNNFNASMTRFCEGSTIYYHGTDPLSANHYLSIKRKHKNSPGPFGEWIGLGGVGASLDGYTGNLNDLFPGYFMLDYIYEFTVGSQDVANCIAWEAAVVEFEIIDCCTPDFDLTYVPECVEDGVPFTVIVELLAPLSSSDIETIYSSYPNFTYLSHYTVTSDAGFFLHITFVSNSCTCEGEILVFDIRLVDCPPTIWIMTDELPCCARECKTATIEDWYYDDCIVVNSNPARYFCLEVSSLETIGNVYQGTSSTGVTCEVTLEDLEITNVAGSDQYTICGYMVFDDPDCTEQAQVTLVLETQSGCCTIEQNFSFPGGCTIDQPCLVADPNIEIIQNSVVSVSLNIPQGQTITVIDHVNNSTNTYTIGSILCNPFWVDQNGNVGGGTACNGIFLPSLTPIDCRTTDDIPISLPYHFEIQWGDCVWVMIGDYCNEFINYPGGVDTGIKRSSEVENVSNIRSGEIGVYPNPMDQSGVLNFDFSELETAVVDVQVTDISGKIIETIIPARDQNLFQYQLDQPLFQGIYFLVFHLADGQVRSTKLVAVE